jgi:hypothetical protein
VRTAKAVPDLAEDHAEEGHRGGLQVGVMKLAAGAGGIAGMPACLGEHVEESPDRQRGDDQAKEQPGADQHRRPDDAF